MKKFMEKHPIATSLMVFILTKSLIKETLSAIKPTVMVLVVEDAIKVPNDTKIEE